MTRKQIILFILIDIIIFGIVGVILWHNAEKPMEKVAPPVTKQAVIKETPLPIARDESLGSGFAVS